MEEYFERLKSKLLEIYKSRDLDADGTYDIVISQNEGKDIASTYAMDLYNLCLYLYYKNNDLQSLSNIKLPFNIEKGLNFEKFCEWLNKYKLYNYYNEVFEKEENYYDRIYRALFFKQKIIETRNWKGFQKDELEGKTSTKKQDFSYKIYIPIENDSLEYFALRLLEECTEKDIDYDFKINNDKSISRGDNVVIYASKENFNDYIKIINSIFENDKITINSQQHLLSFPYSKEISVAPCIDNDNESFSSIG